MNKENIVYVKIKNGIFKCYKSEQMHKPIYYPVESKTNGYIDYNDVEKILTIEDLYQENQELKTEKEQINSLVNSCQEENQEECKHKGLYNTCLPYSTGYKKAIKDKENQQKDFIEYMNKTIEDCNNYSKYIEKKTKELHERSCGKTYIANEIMKNEVAKKILKEILSKYKEIIGVSNENKTNV